MKNREYRREQSQSKFISRLKMWFQIEGGHMGYENWQEYLDKNKWLYKHKHNKFRHSSVANGLDKKHNHKQEREEGKKLINNAD